MCDVRLLFLTVSMPHLTTTTTRMHPGSGPDDAVAVKGNLANQTIKATYKGRPYVTSHQLLYAVSDPFTALMYASPLRIVYLH